MTSVSLPMRIALQEGVVMKRTLAMLCSELAGREPWLMSAIFTNPPNPNAHESFINWVVPNGQKNNFRGEGGAERAHRRAAVSPDDAPKPGVKYSTRTKKKS